jgi:rRNA maturation endonuclease Nob1
MTNGDVRRVMRRCAQCRLLFEVPEGTEACVVCGAAIDGLALPLDANAVPTELGEREPTVRLTAD